MFQYKLKYAYNKLRNVRCKLFNVRFYLYVMLSLLFFNAN